MNTFYVYEVEKLGIKRYVKINKSLKPGLTSLDKSSYWTSKRSLLTWKYMISKVYPNAKILECKLDPKNYD
jgi:hypothetical protein